MSKFIFITALLSQIFLFKPPVYGQYNSSTEHKIDSLIKLMTLSEKIGMIHANSSFSTGGVKRLGIPELTMSDGPQGVRREVGRYWEYFKNPSKNILDSGTYLPTGICLAATWNSQLAYQYGKVLGSEANYRGKDIILGPGINIIRTPLNGRNFEYQSEDPFLISKIAVPYIEGVQSQGVSACVKHFMANNQETNRSKIDVEMSDRALREIYLPGFQAAVTVAKVNTIMSSYNKFRGHYASENSFLLNSILKKEWNFKGVVISDWLAAKNTLEALSSGLDLEMGTDIPMGPHPEKYNKYVFADTAITPYIKNGTIAETVIDDKVRRILRLMFKTHMLDKKRIKGEYNTKEHQDVALKVAEEGIVLLKNNNHILPLNKATIKSIAVIGANANRKNALGGGSSQVKAFYEISPLQGLKDVKDQSTQISYSEGYRIARDPVSNSDSLIQEAVKAAKKADVAIIIGGWTNKNTDTDRLFLDAETVDKPNLQMPFGQDKLINAVIKANPKTIVVLMGGGPIDINKWVNNVDGILETWYAGMEGGHALAKVIFGDVNPSGKLPVTFPKRLEDSPAHKLGEYPGDGKTVHYNEGIYVGYRYYDTFNVEPQFAFGYGLSYTTFQFNNIIVRKNKNKQVIVSATVKNTGSRAGAEVVQLYIKDSKSTLPRPEKELKSFQKVNLKPGESQKLVFTLNNDAFEYYNDKVNKWVFEHGEFVVLLGQSSRAIKLSKKILL